MVSIEPLDMGFAGMASKVQGVGAWSQRTASRPKGRQAIAARMLVSDRELTTRRQKLFYLCGRVVRDLMGGKQTDWWNKWEIRRRVMRRKAETKKESGNRLGPEKTLLARLPLLRQSSPPPTSPATSLAIAAPAVVPVLATLTPS